MTASGDLTTLYNFTKAGGQPQAGLIQATDGNLYGTAAEGGGADCDSCGIIYTITPAGALTTLHTFIGTDGATPYGGLVQATSGIFYGTTYAGGGTGQDDGTVFSLSMGLGPFASLVSTVGNIGQAIGILGQGFTGTTEVSFNGTPASFRVESDTYVIASVPAGATSGAVTVTTSGGTLTSNNAFRVLPQVAHLNPSANLDGRRLP